LIKTYIGFSIKKGSVVYGLESLQAYRKKVHLILLCGSAGEKTARKTNELAAERNIPLRVSPELLSGLTGKINVKVIALTDENLAKPTLNILDGGKID